MVEAINQLNTGLVQQTPIINPIGNVDGTDKSIFLEKELNYVKDKQGFIGKSWNGIKETFDAGLSESDCDETINKYKNGEISFEEALETIKGYDEKQSTMTDLFANITTGIASIALVTAAVAGGPIGWVTAFALGAPVGAAVKTSLKIADRATNNAKNDEFDSKAITKDVVSGAVTGMTSAVSSGIGAGIKSGKYLVSVKNGTKCGAICGGVSGATSYLTDVALDDDKYFNAGDLAKNTFTSALVSGTVGAVVGGTVYGISSADKLASQTVKQTIINDSAASSSRKVLGNCEKEALGLMA